MSLNIANNPLTSISPVIINTAPAEPAPRDGGKDFARMMAEAPGAKTSAEPAPRARDAAPKPKEEARPAQEAGTKAPKIADASSSKSDEQDNSETASAKAVSAEVAPAKKQKPSAIDAKTASSEEKPVKSKRARSEEGNEEAEAAAIAAQIDVKPPRDEAKASPANVIAVVDAGQPSNTHASEGEDAIAPKVETAAHRASKPMVQVEVAQDSSSTQLIADEKLATLIAEKGEVPANAAEQALTPEEAAKLAEAFRGLIERNRAEATPDARTTPAIKGATDAAKGTPAQADAVKVQSSTGAERPARDTIETAAVESGALLDTAPVTAPKFANANAAADKPVVLASTNAAAIGSASASSGKPISREDRVDDKAGRLDGVSTFLDQIAPATTALGAAHGADKSSSAPIAINVGATGNIGLALGQQMVDMTSQNQWLDSISSQISAVSASNGQGNFQITTGGLGPVQVAITQGERGASIRMSVESQAAQTALSDNMDRLLREAQSQAVRIADVRVERAGQVAAGQQSDATNSERGGQQSSGGSQNGAGLGQSTANAGGGQSQRGFASQAGTDGNSQGNRANMVKGEAPDAVSNRKAAGVGNTGSAGRGARYA